MRPGLRSRRNPTELRSTQPTASAGPTAAQGSISSTAVQNKAKATKSRARNLNTSAKTAAKPVKESPALAVKAVATSPRYNLRRRHQKPQPEIPTEPLPLKNRAAPKLRATATTQTKSKKSQPTRTSKPLGSKSPPGFEISEKDSSSDHLLSQRLAQNIGEAFRESYGDFDSNSGAEADNSLTWSEDDEFVSPLRAYGYEPPDSDSMDSTRDSTPGGGSRKSEGQGGRTNAIGPENNQYDVLLEKRNVDLQPFLSGAGKDLERRIRAPNAYKSTKLEEDAWARDLQKCRTACEAVFQHTIMIEVIDRHSLQNKLDYTCDAVWICPSLPFRPPEGGVKSAPIKKPKPDLTVAFIRDEIIDTPRKRDLGDLGPHMCPEGETVIQQSRAFPFFIMEAKGAQAKSGDQVATRQCLHTASLALYNIWKFYEGEANQQEFFEKIRVFSATGHGGTLKIRAHWATETAKGEHQKHIVNLVKVKGPLSFSYQELVAIEGEAYRRDKVIGMIKNVLDYGRTDLLPLLQQAVKTKLERKDKEMLRLAMVLPETGQSPSSSKKRTSPSPNSRGRSDNSANKRQAMGGAGSFTSTTSANRLLDETHLYESDRSFTEVAG